MDLPPEIVAILAAFAPPFSDRVWVKAQLLAVGALLAPGDRTGCATLRVPGLSQERHLTALVMSAGRCRHLAAATTTELADQVGVSLVVLEVHRGTRRWLALADGAVDPRVVRGVGPRRLDDDRVLVAPGEAVPAGPEPDVPRARTA